MRRILRLTVLFGFAGGLLACEQASSRPTDAGTGVPVADAGGPRPLTWSHCPLLTGGTGNDAECGVAELPLDWSKPEGRKISVFVKRLRAAGTHRGALWLVNGGLVASGATLELPARDLFARKAPDLDIYIPDHRGTGRSSRLQCPQQPPMGAPLDDADVPACVESLKAEWGDDLAHFNTTDAARDLGWLIESERKPGEVAFAYGISYGTAVLHRYLQIFPTQPTGVVLEALCMPGHCQMDKLDQWINQMAERFFAECAKDTFCSSKLGPAPWGKLTDTLASLDRGHCPAAVAAGLSRKTVRTTLGNMLGYSGWNVRPAVAAILYRLARCSDGDLPVLRHFARAVLTPPDPPPLPEQLEAVLTGYNVTFSQFWASPPPSIESLQAIYDKTSAATGAALAFAPARDSWPIPPQDEYMGKWASTQVPMLMLHGTLDFLPLEGAEAARQHFSGFNQTVAIVPRAPHATVFAPTREGKGCSGALIGAFLKSPKEALDLSCLGEIQPIKFETLPGQWADVLFRTADIWEGTL
ncbi:MAG: alpha/beta fold hydrolase [Deltaproteobacteria bacterium]|nr:alpha/beta fold hydrolase [Deltaproteobacteria bacterium]